MGPLWRHQRSHAETDAFDQRSFVEARCAATPAAFQRLECARQRRRISKQRERRHVWAAEVEILHGAWRPDRVFQAREALENPGKWKCRGFLRAVAGQRSCDLAAGAGSAPALEGAEANGWWSHVSKRSSFISKRKLVHRLKADPGPLVAAAAAVRHGRRLHPNPLSSKAGAWQQITSGRLQSHYGRRSFLERRRRRRRRKCISLSSEATKDATFN